jgi:hypothetical protein
MHAIYVDVLPLPPAPVLGVGAEYDVLSSIADKSAEESHAFGIHADLESGVNAFAPTRNKTNMYFTDYGAMIYYRYDVNRANLSILAGWSYRDVESWDDDHTSGRFKYGIVGRYILLSGEFHLDVELKMMYSSLGKAYMHVEVGPASAGVSFGWHNW